MAGSNRGFLVLHDKPRYAEALAKLAERVRNGTLAHNKHILDGADAARGAQRN